MSNGQSRLIMHNFAYFSFFFSKTIYLKIYLNFLALKSSTQKGLTKKKKTKNESPRHRVAQIESQSLWQRSNSCMKIIGIF